MTPEPPEFLTNTLSPLSPLPIHPPEPSNITVLRNQTDPVFNMTSTHIDSETSNAVPADSTLDPDTSPKRSPSADSSFSDAYKDAPQEAEKVQKDDQGTDESDDYAMTFDSDEDGQADSTAVAEPTIQAETVSLPVNVSKPDSAPSSSTASPEATITDVSQAGLTSSHITTSEEPTTSVPSVNALDSRASQSAEAPAITKTHTYEAIANGEIDIQQLLDNITANAEKNESASASHSSNTSPVDNSTFPHSIQPHSSLPPRPNLPQTFQRYGSAPGAQASSSYRPPGAPPSLVAAGAPGTSTETRSGLPPPPAASFYPPALGSPALPSNIHRLSAASVSVHSHDDTDDADAKWGPEVQKIYDQFLEEERGYVTEGLWDQFPLGSRLFIGNLPSEMVTKRDLFHIFHHYGRIAQVSIKQAYGFVQYHDAAACHAALAREQGAEVRGRKMHLEISKPQKNTRNAQNGAQKRNRSPDYSRGGASNGRARGNDRYDGRPPIRSDEYGRPIRIRDDYRPMRSPSPPRGNFRGREDSMPRGRDSYDSRDRRRSRSPYDQRDDRYRQRSPSPRAREANEDADLQIPRRDPRNIPDVQLILLEQLDRQFVSWVENEMRSRGVKVEIMFLSPRLPLQAVIRRQILEGVHAVAKLDMRSQNMSKIPLQVFDRQAGANNVRFDEYVDLDPKIAAELVLRAKQNHQILPQQPISPQIPPPQQAYAPPQFQPGQSYQPQPQLQYQPPIPAPAPAPVAQPNLASLVSSMDNATLQKLLGTLTAPQPAPQQQNIPAVQANSGIDLASILGGLQAQASSQMPQQQYHQQQAAPPLNQYQNLSNGYAAPPQTSLPPQQAQPQQSQVQGQQSALQVQNIMAQLARFRQ